VYELSRRFLGDREGTVWKEGTLFPYITEAYRSLQRKLAENGHQIFIAETEITVPASTTSLTKATTPALPANLVVPWLMKERENGTTGKLQRMTRRIQDLPEPDPGDRIRFWKYAGNVLKLVPSNRAVNVWLEYEAELADVTKLTDPILISGAVGALAHGTAMLVDGSHAEEYMADVAELENADLRANQFAPVRPIPYRHRWS